MSITTKSTWKIDPLHSEISFKVKHMMISTIRGHFDVFDAKIETDNDEFIDADFKFTAKTDSVNTKNLDRDQHLMSTDFFNVEAFPEIQFKSKSFNGVKLIGDLTIKDVTKEVTLNVDFNGIAVDPYGKTKAGFEIQGSVNRKDFNLTWSAVTEAGKVVVSDTVKLIADLQFIKE